MFRSVKNIRLIAVLVILVAAYAGLKLFKNTGRSKSFREELVVIDTSKVDRIIITRAGSSFEVSKDNDDDISTSGTQNNNLAQKTEENCCSRCGNRNL